MHYRVSYCQDNSRCTAEVTASSPQEAVVKFHMLRQDDRSARRPATVLSVWQDPTDEPAAAEW